MIVKLCLYLYLAHLVVSQVLYDAYFGKPVKDDRRNDLELLNLTAQCTVLVEPCKKHEGRRIDGTCVNPKYPSRGATLTPMLRMRPAKFGLGNTLRPAMNGSELPSARIIRTKILNDGYPEDFQFSMLTSHVIVFTAADVGDVTSLLTYSVASDCCVGNTPNRVNPTCIAIPVPQDDPYLRRTGIRCMNLTRQITFQELGCIPNTIPAERINLPTPTLDLTPVYGYLDARERQIRTYQGGLLRTEQRDGVERPPGTSPLCIRNRRPIENACYEFGDAYHGNLLSGIYLTAMWYYREHNRLARKLAAINPCWDDQTLFETARQINIAEYQYMVYYELMAEILGYKNALATGVIYDTKGYVNDFDERYKPGVYHEYVVGTRWFHNFQDGRTDLYSQNGKYLGTRTAVDDELRSGILEVNNTEADLTQGAFRQRAAKLDFTMEPDLAERVFGELQAASDIAAIDMQRGRDQGLAPYNEYRKICGLPVAHKFKDFEDTIYPDKVEQLRRLYDDEVDDMELMVALYSEKLLKDAWVPPTLFCIMVETLLNWRKSDRFFFEHGDTYAALTLPQLNEVRRTSVARLLCDNGDDVEDIQPRAFLNVGKKNKITQCNNIPGMDLQKWSDPKCHPEKDDHSGDTWKTPNYNLPWGDGAYEMYKKK